MATRSLAQLRHDGGGPATPLVVAHGLFGSARNWGVLSKRLSDRGPVIAVDMRNHGASFHDPDHGYDALAADLARTIEDEGARGPVDLLGHSMGGKAAMVLALTRPELLRRLVVADIAPVAYAHSQSHLIDAMRGVDLSRVARRSEAAEQLAQVPDDGTRSFLLQSLDAAAGRWTLNLDALDARMPDIVGFPDVSGRFDGPTLFLAGADSDYVRPGHRATIASFFPRARVVRIPGAGHWLHAQKPRETEAAIRAFLDA